MVMQRPLGTSTAFSIDSLIGPPPQPGPGPLVYTGYPMFVPYRSVVLQPPPPPPGLQQALHPPHPQIPNLQGGFCSSLAQNLSLTSTLMASLPSGFSSAQQHHEVRKFGSQALQDLRLDPEDGKSFLPGKESALPLFHESEAPVQTSTGRLEAPVSGTESRWFKTEPRTNYSKFEVPFDSVSFGQKVKII